MRIARRLPGWTAWISLVIFTLWLLLDNAIPSQAQTAPPDPTPTIAAPADAQKLGLDSLRTSIANNGLPQPPNLGDFVRNKQAAIRLGKALFWDMQVGSDGVQACATCHFEAGADNRSRNQVNPDLNRVQNQRNGDIRGFFDAPSAPDTTF